MDYLDLNLNLSDEDLQIKMAARKFAHEVIKPIAKELDKMTAEEAIAKDSPLWTFLKLAYQNQYHCILLPGEVGGAGVSPIQVHIIYEEFAAAGMGLTVLLAVACFPFFLATLFENEELIEKFVKPFCECTDASIIGCWAITEPDHGSDIFYFTPETTDPKCRMNVTVVEDGDHYIINGQKSAWVSGGTIATHALLFPQIEPSRGMEGGAICIVPLDLPGVSKGKPLEKVGARDLNQGEIFFDNVRIPKSYMLCDNDGYEQMLEMVVSIANACVGVISTGLARAAFEEALEYAKVRVQGGKPIIEHTWMQNRIFNLFAKVETCRALARAVQTYNFSMFPPSMEYSIVSKTQCSQMAYEVAHEAIQIFGGYGLTREYPVEKLFRDGRALLVMDGLNEMLSAEGGKVVANTYPR